jgi:NAD-dependent dihydropyrimidine dehydrogenase PreA subunit
MPYVIGADCVDVQDRSCVETCPVDAIYEGARKLYIHPEECIDCGACQPACPVEAVFWARDADAAQEPHVGDALAFFYTPLPGRDDAIGAPGGAETLGVLGIDTPLVAALPGGD